MTTASLHSQIGIVQQDVFLFAGTIRENIVYGRLWTDEAAVRRTWQRRRAWRKSP